MRIAAEGHITTEALMWNQNTNQKTISGMVLSYFLNMNLYLYYVIKSQQYVNQIKNKQVYDIILCTKHRSVYKYVGMQKPKKI